ncbi:hypothetical protein FACS1894185_5950 [Betaproteobacteria bacterium]|nr:hypothetical protein FACS1894185_5950 [Betaproteobacteria bacterium]GHU15036.1 hypothetical protein FACS189441_6100 [Betaproteobacteria bacterium]
MANADGEKQERQCLSANGPGLCKEANDAPRQDENRSAEVKGKFTACGEKHDQ